MIVFEAHSILYFRTTNDVEIRVFELGDACLLVWLLIELNWTRIVTNEKEFETYTGNISIPTIPSHVLNLYRHLKRPLRS
jgi:hypothetical protein